MKKLRVVITIIITASAFLTASNVSAELKATGETSRERALDGIIHIEKELILNVPEVPRLCDQMDRVKRRVNVGDCELYCEIDGKGVALVLLHGGPGATHHYFHPSFSQAKNFAKIIYYDQRGCGLSDYKKSAGYSIEQAVEDLENLRKSLKVDKWIVLGNSYGGLLAQCYTVKYPESVSGLILVTSCVAMPVAMKPTRQYEFISEAERAKIKAIHSNSNLSSEQSLYNAWLNGDWKRQCYYKPSRERIAQGSRYVWKHDINFNSIMSQDMGGVDLEGAFDGCPIPTIIIEGRWDLTWNTDKPSILQKNHPNAQLLFFEDSGHTPFDDEPEKFFNVLRDYVLNLPDVSRRDMELWKKYLSKLKKEKKKQKDEFYPFLKTQVSEQEKASIERFNAIKKRILAGEKYFDLSTPVDSMLSYMSAVISKDTDTYRKTSAISQSSSIEFTPSWINQYKNLYIYRIQKSPQKPAEGDVYPVYIYVMAGEEKDFTGVEVFIYHQGGWRKLFNNCDNLRTNWREQVDWAKGLMK
ncbi:MAG: alpha/beta fold hydrolase [Planctomycetota bacterium]|jgi:proline iminopeptidase